jgi:hypothetical protein
VPAWAWPEPTAPHLEREQPASDPVDRSQFVIVASEDFQYRETRFRAGAHLRKDNPLVRRSSAAILAGWFPRCPSAEE